VIAREVRHLVTRGGVLAQSHVPYGAVAVVREPPAVQTDPDSALRATAYVKLTVAVGWTQP
jgi:hypothetical protein